MSMSKSIKRLGLLGVCAVVICLALPLSALATDKLIVKDSTGTNTVFDVTDQGTVAIGAAAASAGTQTEIVSSTAATRGLFISQTSNDGNAAVFKIRKSRGAGAILSGDFIANYGFMGFDGTSFGDAGRIRTFAAENWTTTAHGATMVFENVPPGTPTAVEHMRITGTGNVGIGTTNPTHLFQVGTAAFSDGTGWFPACSREYKDNIKDLSFGEALNTLMALNPVTYTYKVAPDKERAGFIAEDVPELISTKDRKSVGELDITAILTKVVQEQQNIVSEQQKTIAELTEKLKGLEQQVNRIKAKDLTVSIDPMTKTR